VNLALLKGNRFNPWHLQVFDRLPDTAVTAFRADSEIQRHFNERDDGSLGIGTEPIFFDTQAGPILDRYRNLFTSRYMNREPRIVPFYERLREFDVVQTWELFTDWTAQALEARAHFGTPVSVMVWDNIPFNMERNTARRAMKERAAAAADVFIVHTERSQRMLAIEGVSTDRIVRINPGVDIERFAPGPGRRADFGLRDDEFVILFVGWLLPRKGIDFLILALRELVNDDDLRSMKFRLAVVGSGPGKDRVEQLIERTHMQDYCTFTGSVSYDRMPDAFRAADVFVLPSIATPEWQEQFGMSLIEAMASGVPVVSTMSGAIPEVTGERAVLCQPNDFVSLFEALKDLALHPEKRQAMGNAGRAHAVAHFGLDAFARRLNDVYVSLAGRPV